MDTRKSKSNNKSSLKHILLLCTYMLQNAGHELQIGHW